MSESESADFAAFREWFCATRGVGRRTAITAVSQVRRVLAECAPVTEASLRDWWDRHPTHLRTPVASNWRRYVEWWASQGVPGMPQFPARPTPRASDVPDEVKIALGALQVSGVPPTTLHAMVWRPLERGSALHNALAAGSPQIATGELTALRTEAGIVTVSTAHLTPILAWGHGGSPVLDAPLVPEAPGSKEAMSVTRLRRMARRGRQLADK
jgi:hypothetical protein